VRAARAAACRRRGRGGTGEAAVSAAFAHTAVLAGRPPNAVPLAEAGRNFGRLAHLLDAVEDLQADRSAGAYNPLLATGTSQERARQHCDDALAGLRGAVAALELDERVLTESLLMREVGVAVDQVFADLAGGRARWRTASAGLPCAQGVRCRHSQPDFGPVSRRRSRCGECWSDCCCDGCCEACGDCGDCGSCCDCSC
jgi:hypothetical protein